MRYLNDVSMGRGDGVPKKQMIVLISCVSVTVTRREEILQTSFKHGPIAFQILCHCCCTFACFSSGFKLY